MGFYAPSSDDVKTGHKRINVEKSTAGSFDLPADAKASRHKRQKGEKQIDSSSSPADAPSKCKRGPNVKKTSSKSSRVTVAKISVSAATTKLLAPTTEEPTSIAATEASESTPAQEASISEADALLVSAMSDPRAPSLISSTRILSYEH